MLKVLSCLTQQHDWRLVPIAAAVCLIACLTAFRLYSNALRANGALQFAWIGFTGLAAGCGIWITHFVAMLAYAPGFATGYEPVGTVLSLVLAVAATAIGFGLAVRRVPQWEFVAGAVLGLGVSLMHYTGMQAFRTQGELTWSLPHVVASVAIGCLVGVAAMVVAGKADSWRKQVGAAGLFTVAICGMHFTAMGAVTILPDTSVVVANQVLNHGIMAAALGLLGLIIVIAALCTLMIEGWSQKSSAIRLNEAVEAIPQALALFDRDDRVVIWNSRYAELTRECAHVLKPGVSFRELLAAGLEAGHYPEAKGHENDWLELRLEARRQAPSTVEQHTSDDRYLRIEDRPMADGGRVSVIVDLTDLKRDALALAKARDDAQAANRAKSEFLANMSHEIRTPLNGVVGLADVLAATDLDDRQTEMVEMIRGSAVQLERLLADVLDLARIESGKVEIRPEPFNLADAARVTAALYQPQAVGKGVTLIVDIAPEADRLVTGDIVRVKQILGNLISNAVKFTSQGEVRLSIKRQGGWWRCAVKDDGIGFAAEDKERLFGRFQQADGSVTRRFGGTGLGLSICRQLAELMGAELDAESTPGEGSTFTLMIDMPDAEAPSEAPAAEAASDGDAPELRVLLADDHPTNRKVVELILDQAGVDLVSVENGQQALEAFKEGRFDVVLMDMQMPVMDGLSATRAIRAYEREHGLVPAPVVMLTANALPEHVEASRAAGAERHLTKPITAPTLLAALIEIAENAPARRAA